MDEFPTVDELRHKVFYLQDQIDLAKDLLLWDGVPNKNLTIYGMVCYMREEFPKEWGALRDAMLARRDGQG